MTPDLTSLLADGSHHDLGHLHAGWTATVRVVPGAGLLLPTGRVVAGDPGPYHPDEVDALVLAPTVGPGRYRVELVVADIGDAAGTPVYTVNAAARLVVRDEPVATWRPAAPAGFDAAADAVYAYPVDGGTGSFGSPEALAALGADGSPAPSRQDGPAAAALARIADQLRDGTVEPGRAFGLRMMLAASDHAGRSNLPDGPGEVGVYTDPTDGLQVVSFNSGDGDGSYVTWVGRTASDEVACFVTDFAIVTDPATV